jgi:hypothetical protein
MLPNQQGNVSPNQKYSSELSQARDDGSSLVKASQGLDLKESSGLHFVSGGQARESSGFKWR